MTSRGAILTFLHFLLPVLGVSDGLQNSIISDPTPEPITSDLTPGSLITSNLTFGSLITSDLSPNPTPGPLNTSDPSNDPSPGSLITSDLSPNPTPGPLNTSDPSNDPSPGPLISSDSSLDTRGTHEAGHMRASGNLTSHTGVAGEEKLGGMQAVKHFYLWTRKNQGNSSWQLLDPSKPDSITRSNFRARKTYIIIHGFLGWGTEPWILQLKDKLLKITNSNVVSVDWPAGTEWWLPSYYPAVHRVPKVGMDCAALLRGGAKYWGLDYRDVHFIGHSLGAHVSGFASKPLAGVGRITGLDPAGLTYHNVPPAQRLDASDAENVDIIHTNSCKTLDLFLDCYGLNENIGHIDFWPNGGKHQPACRKGEIGCDHEMAYVYYMESLDYNTRETYFLARSCSRWADFEAGECSCGKEAQYMGYFVNNRMNGTFYLATNTVPPYAKEDSGCPPGTATGPGPRKLTMGLSITAACIALGMTLAFLGVTNRCSGLSSKKIKEKQDDVAVLLPS